MNTITAVTQRHPTKEDTMITYNATYPELIYAAAATRVRQMEQAQAAHEARRARRVRRTRRVQHSLLAWTRRLDRSVAHSR